MSSAAVLDRMFFSDELFVHDTCSWTNYIPQTASMLEMFVGTSCPDIDDLYQHQKQHRRPDYVTSPIVATRPLRPVRQHLLKFAPVPAPVLSRVVAYDDADEEQEYNGSGDRKEQNEKGRCLQKRASGDDNDGASAAGAANKGLVTVVFSMIASWQRKPCHGSRQHRS
jgi:hypothetical protein